MFVFILYFVWGMQHLFAIKHVVYVVQYETHNL